MLVFHIEWLVVLEVFDFELLEDQEGKDQQLFVDFAFLEGDVV